MRKCPFRGCATAIITPFRRDNTVDLDAFKSLIDRQIEASVDGLVVCGTTGEASTLSTTERMKVIETAVYHTAGRIPVIAGTGTNNTETSIAASRDAAALGVDAVLVVTPYYNKATQSGLVEHYSRIAGASSVPVILYNVPSRTGVSCSAETYAQLSAHENIAGVKEAGGDLSLVQKTRSLCPEDFFIWSGNDEDTAPIMLLGGVGVISVVSNVLPKKMRELTDACSRGEFKKAGALQLEVRKIADVLFREVNPIPVKTALSMMGACEEVFRSPLTHMSAKNREELRTVMEEYQLL